MNAYNINKFHLGTIRASENTGHGHSMAEGHKEMNILLAEDDKNFGFILKRELEEERYAVDLATNGVDAVLNFINKTYGFVLLDIKMPRLSGADALRIIKEINPHVPVITFSGNAGSDEIAETIRCGAMKCLVKPLQIAQLKDDIRTHILR